MKGDPLQQKAPRLSVRETRAALIDSGCQLFLEPRTDWGLGRISLGEAISRSAVSRASAYRAFSEDQADPQESFRLAVLLEVISRTLIDTSVVGEVLAGLDPNEFENDADGMAAELREVIRRWTNLNFFANLDNELVRAVDVVRSVVGLSPDPDPQILAAVQHALERSRIEFHPYLQAFSERYGLRPRPWTNLDQIQRMFVSITAMAMIEWTIDETTRVIMRPTGPDGEDREWSLNGTVIEGICLNMLEEDPEAELSADIQTWLL